ncbi:hypothetical protein [Sphingomonas faeni]|uniref:hypothetical protein n=1 Tax=Sphingomonas faeni TaxID=185950 RepID=UPI0020C79313|nr:hypothetical protein [Sphingomonas faeni]MCP8891022.1 hypothetical protein [Sphingomonas faeni]
MSRSAPASRPWSPAIGHWLKRWLYIGHRWLGIGSCILFAMWFVSGLVMIYVPFPALTEGERLAGLPMIDWGLVRVVPGQSLRAEGFESPPRVMVLEMRGALPVWRVRNDSGGGERSISALDGTLQLPPTEGQARGIAARFGRDAVIGVERIERDQWTVSGAFDRHRPLWKVRLAGADARSLYISGSTGAVVLDTVRTERFWNWLGSVPHWLYFTVVRQDNAVWRQVVMWVSGPCIVAGLTGFWIGILRTRFGRRRYRDGRMTPYRGWMLWHHWAGLIGGLFLLTWIFSGWLSVDPFRLFGGGGVTAQAEARYEDARWASAPDIRRLGHVARGARQVELAWVRGRSVLEIRWVGRTRIVDARTLAPFAPVIAPAALVPGAPIVGTERLTAPDAYWYALDGLPKLPVVRVRFGDAGRTWVHIDPASGRVLGSVDARGRVYRWLFDLLHKWDLTVLTGNRPVWDVMLWALSILGLVTSVSGIWLGWKRLRRPKRSPVTRAGRDRAVGEKA